MKNNGSIIKCLFVALTTYILAACTSTPQQTVTLDNNLFANENLKIGVIYYSPKEKATTHIYGASCLLCYAVASALTSNLDNYLAANISDEELLNMKELVIAEYSSRSKNVEFIELAISIENLSDFYGDPGYATKDFRVLKEELNVDVLVVFEVAQHGAHRSFSNYIPNGDPKGHISGLLYSVDLDTNAYVQYLEINEMIQPSGEWDEPPTFPSVTTAYYQAVENAKEQIRKAI